MSTEPSGYSSVTSSDGYEVISKGNPDEVQAHLDAADGVDADAKASEAASELGKRGGRAIVRKRGKAYMSKLARKGGKARWAGLKEQP